MANNCLVTKLKSSVANSNLEVLGYLKVKVNAIPGTFSDQGQCIFRVICSGECTIDVIDGEGFFVDAFNKMSDSSAHLTHKEFTGDSGNLFAGNGNYTLLVSSKYAITALVANGSSSYHNIVGINADDLLYCQELESIESNYSEMNGNIRNIPSNVTNLRAAGSLNLTGSIDDLKSNSIKNILIGDNANITGNVSSLSTMSLELVNLRSTQVSGNINVFNKPTVTLLQINDTNVNGSIESLTSCVAAFSIDVDATAVEGSLDVLAAAQAPNRSSGATLAVRCNGIITYKVNNVDTVIPTGETRTITFDGQGGYTIA